MFNRSRRNLARWFTLSMGMILVVIAGVIYYQKAVDQLEVIDTLLYKKAKVMASSIQCEDDRKQKHVDLSNVPLLGNNPPPQDSEVVSARWYDASGQLRQLFGLLPSEKLSKLSEFETIKVNDITDNNEAFSQPIIVRGDSDLLSQVVTNILGNARKYTPAGGIINLRLSTDFCFCIIQVEDNGIGIAAADLPHIFERFYRVEKERSHATGSFGLGLAIAPGATITPINESWTNDPEQKAVVESHIPMGRAGTSEEMAAAVAFLTSDEAAYITGQTLFIDGGLSLYADFREAWSA